MITGDTSLVNTASKERERLVLKLVKERDSLVSNYKNTIKKTGGLLTQSMTYAYSKGLNDALKLLTKDDE